MDSSSTTKQEIQSRKRPQLQPYTQLLEQLDHANLESSLAMDPAIKAKLSLTKLLITKKFSAIDEEILELSRQRRNSNAGEFFSDILLFEAKRLAFKEEALKCQTPANQTQV